MSLPENVYRELESVVGKEYISDREYILAGNRNPMPSDFGRYETPEAILLPGSAEEVQAIVKICNTHGIAYIAYITGLLAAGLYPNRPGTIPDPPQTDEQDRGNQPGGTGTLSSSLACAMCSSGRS